MYDHILIATDGSELAAKGLDAGLALAKALVAEVTVIRVAEPWTAVYAAPDLSWVGGPEIVAQYDRAEDEIGKAILDRAAAAAKALGVAHDVLHVKNDHPATAIVRTAEERGCGLIVMASHGRRGLNRIFLGSQTAEVLAHSKIPVLVVR